MEQRIIIYTCIPNCDFELKQPYNAAKWHAEGFDYRCFVPKGKQTVDRIGAWVVEELPVSWEDEQLNLNIPKLNPQTVLEEEYEHSLWIDRNVSIEDDSVYEKCMDLQSRGVLYAGVENHERSCAYDEALFLVENSYESYETAMRAVKFLRKKGLRRHVGLHDTSVIYRMHNHEKVLELDRWWWECLVTYAGGHDDLLMQSFALADTPGLKWEYFIPEDVSLEESAGFSRVSLSRSLIPDVLKEKHLRRLRFFVRFLVF